MGMGTYIDDLPSTSQLIIELFLYTGDCCNIGALFDLVLRTNHDFFRFSIPEDEDLLRAELDDENRDVILQHFAGCYLGR